MQIQSKWRRYNYRFPRTADSQCSVNSRNAYACLIFKRIRLSVTVFILLVKRSLCMRVSIENSTVNYYRLAVFTVWITHRPNVYTIVENTSYYVTNTRETLLDTIRKLIFFPLRFLLFCYEIIKLLSTTFGYLVSSYNIKYVYFSYDLML